MESILVGMGKFQVANQPSQLTCVGLGSCVAVVLHDSKKRIGAVAHIMLPFRHEAKNQENPEKFADSSIQLMLAELKASRVLGFTMFTVAIRALLDLVQATA